MKSTGAKILSLVLAVVMMFGFSAVAFADINDILYTKTSDGFGSIAGYSGAADADGLLKIEGYDDIEELTLKYVADGAFKYSTADSSKFYLADVKTLVLDEGIEVIGEESFANLPALEKVIFKGNVTLGKNAFANCKALTEVVFEKDAYLGEGAFANCKNLLSLIISDTASFNAEKSALVDTSWYATYPVDFVTLGTTLVDYKGADSEVVIPLNITAIGATAFKGNTTLKKITLSMNVTTLGDECFMDCSALTDVVFSDYGTITEVGTDVFTGTPYFNNFEGDFFTVESILIKYLGDDAYVSIPNTITEIAPNCFDGCYAAKTPNGYTWVVSAIMVPASLTEFGENCFALAQLDDGTYYVPMLYAYSDTPAMKAITDAGYLATVMPKLGDIDNDGKITSADARLALRLAVKLDIDASAETKHAANINGDDKISSEDARLILRMAVKLEKYTMEDLLYMPATDFEILQAYAKAMKTIAKYNAGYTKTVENTITAYDMSSAGRIHLLDTLKGQGITNSKVTYEADTIPALENIDFCKLITTDGIKNATCSITDSKYTITITFKDVLDNTGTSDITKVFPVATRTFYNNIFAKNSWWQFDNEPDWNGNNIRKFDLTYNEPVIKLVVNKDTFKVESCELSVGYHFAIDGKIHTIEISSKGYKTGDATLDRLDKVTYSDFIY